jgi:hypothetical protein
MRQLHFANIANVAYGYGKILRSTGVEADVLCYDLSHILSLPEWVEGDFDIQVGDEWHPDLNRREIAAIDIPQWYRRIRTADVASPSGTDTSAFWNRNWVEQIVRFSQRFGPRWTVRHEDVAAYQLLCEKLQAHHFGRYDLIFGYAYGAVPPLLSSTLPYVPVEIGTLRDTVNIDSPLGRLRTAKAQPGRSDCRAIHMSRIRSTRMYFAPCPPRTRPKSANPSAARTPRY